MPCDAVLPKWEKKIQTEVLIRPLTEEDLDRVLEIEGDCFPDPWTRRNFQESMALPFYVCLAATGRPGSRQERIGWEESGGEEAFRKETSGRPGAGQKDEERLIGYGILCEVAGEGTIMNLAVDASKRRCGAGGLLLKRLMEEGRKKGSEDFTLEVRASNLPAIRLYEGAGFVTEGVRKGYYEKPREDALIMWRRKKGTGLPPEYEG